MQLISPTDSLFLLGESREHPMHVGGLQVFEPPEGAGPEFIRDLYTSMLAHRDISPTFLKHPAELFGGIANVSWSVDRDIDMEYHLRRSALPQPGRVRELLELISRLHGTLLDRHRPLWETHLIEGLNDGRFAVYTKVHHALVDGVSAMKLMRRALSSDPTEHEIRVPWGIKPRPRGREVQPSLMSGITSALGSVAALGPSAVTVARAALIEQQLTLPFGAPKTMFNVPIGGARRCAAQSWPIKRFIAIKEAAGVTLNDVVLGMCSGALRAYLVEHSALPDRPLIAMVPVNMRAANDTSAGGNQVGTILCSLATDIEDPGQRLAAIHASMSGNKKVFSQLPRLQQLALSAFNVAPMTLGLIPALGAATAPPFNVVISNVPGAREPLYWNGARLDGNYPMSIATEFQALNITLTNNADNLDFGLVGCRRSIPHLQRMLGHLERSLADLERAVGV